MKKNTSIIFTGDIGFDKYMEGKWEDENLLSKPILDFFHSADHVCANVRVPYMMRHRKKVEARIFIP